MAHFATPRTRHVSAFENTEPELRVQRESNHLGPAALQLSLRAVAVLRSRLFPWIKASAFVRFR